MTNELPVDPNNTQGSPEKAGDLHPMLLKGMKTVQTSWVASHRPLLWAIGIIIVVGILALTVLALNPFANSQGVVSPTDDSTAVLPTATPTPTIPVPTAIAATITGPTATVDINSWLAGEHEINQDQRTAIGNIWGITPPISGSNCFAQQATGNNGNFIDCIFQFTPESLEVKWLNQYTQGVSVDDTYATLNATAHNAKNYAVINFTTGEKGFIFSENLAPDTGDVAKFSLVFMDRNGNLISVDYSTGIPLVSYKNFDLNMLVNHIVNVAEIGLGGFVPPVIVTPTPTPSPTPTQINFSDPNQPTNPPVTPTPNPNATNENTGS